MISLIAALSERTRVIGRGGDLVWHIPEDLKRFKTLTLGHPVIMGRKTWESLPPKFRPLPGRTNIVVTRKKEYVAEGATVTHSFESALARAGDSSTEVFVIGGEELYTSALPYTDRLYLTLIDAEEKGDAYFPPYEKDFPVILSEEQGEWSHIK